MHSVNDLPPESQKLRQAFEALVDTFTERGIQYAIIGGLASIQHSRVRTTDDIDALLTLPQIAMPGLFEALEKRGFAVELQKNIRELRDEGLTIIKFRDVIVDLLRPMTPTYFHVLDRAITAEVLGQTVRISSAEGLIVTKLIAMRPQDEADIKDIMAAYGSKLDIDFIRAELETFTKPDDESRIKFDKWVSQQISNQ